MTASGDGLEAAMAHVPDDADHGHGGHVAVHVPELDPLSDRVVSREPLASQSLRNRARHERSSRVSRVSKRRPRFNGNAHGFEIRARDRRVVRVPATLGILREPPEILPDEGGGSCGPRRRKVPSARSDARGRSATNPRARRRGSRPAAVKRRSIISIRGLCRRPIPG
jgi:hypothetical protein